MDYNVKEKLENPPRFIVGAVSQPDHLAHAPGMIRGDIKLWAYRFEPLSATSTKLTLINHVRRPLFHPALNLLTC